MPRAALRPPRPRRGGRTSSVLQNSVRRIDGLHFYVDASTQRQDRYRRISLPDFTTGELAALKIVADECLAHGACDLSKNEIGARAGVCKTVVKRALKLAEVRLTMISVLRRPRSGRKHLTSIIRIIRAEWLTWLDKGNRRAYAIKACDRAKPDFKRFRGVQLDPPRAQDFRNAGSDRVDRTEEKRNRTGAGRAGL